MKVLIACECSQTVCKEFRALGHEAYSCDIEPCYIENPVGVMNTVYRKPDQIIEPYQFAESVNDAENYVTKRTCLWLKGLEPLYINYLPRPNNAEKYGRWSNGKAGCWHERVSTDKARVRSKTFRGIARAMAEQWGIYD